MKKNTIKFFWNLFNPFLDFIYPPFCLACEIKLDSNAPVCESCWETLQKRSRIRRHTGDDFTYLEDPLYMDDVITFWEYSTVIERLIHSVKYEGFKRLGRLLGILAAECLLEGLSPRKADMIIPVPLHPVRQRERGFNQSRIYAEQISQYADIPMNPKILHRIRYTKTQTELTASERQSNMRDAFKVTSSSEIQDKTVILIDDVITSGATINSCAKACLTAGARSVIGIGLARPGLG